MAINDLGSYIALLKQHNELTCITVPVDPLLEISAITDRVSKQDNGGIALLFERPEGSRFRVATNLFGSPFRSLLAIGAESPLTITERMTELMATLPDTDFAGLAPGIAALPPFQRYSPITTTLSDDSLLEMASPDVTIFPFLQNWPCDGSAEGFPRYMTLPQVFTVDPDGGNPNSGLYRIQVRGARELAVQWKAGSGAASHAEEYRRRGLKMPVAIVLGGSPAALFSSLFPLPGNLDEMTFAGFLRQEQIIMSDCLNLPLAVPSGGELVIEGFVEPDDTVMEGPFGNHSGFYSPAMAASRIRIVSVRHRPDAIIPATVVGPPPMEDCWMARIWESILLALIRKCVPRIVRIHSPAEWIFHQSAIISLENPHPGMVHEIVRTLWDTPWFSASRILIFIDAESGLLTDKSTAVWRCINLLETPGDIIRDDSGCRMAIDATAASAMRRKLCMDNRITQNLRQKWSEYSID